MPTVLRLAGLRYMTYPGDHRPGHVHVIGRGGEAVFNLNCPKGPPNCPSLRRLGVDTWRSVTNSNGPAREAGADGKLGGRPRKREAA